jgi:NAD(P)H-dependent FMN reductase
MTIEIISGSPREDSITYRLVLFLKLFFSEKTKHKINVIDVRDWELPLLQQIYPSVDDAPEKFKLLTGRIAAANAFLLVTPEYNGSYSSALQNLLDHFPRHPHKAFGIVTASTGSMGGIRASQQLLLLIPALYGIASPYMLITPYVDKKFSDDGILKDESFQKSVDVFVNEFLWLSETLNHK